MKKILDEVRASPHQKVKVAITDLDGVLRGKYLNKEKFLAVAESSFGFCNVVFGWDSADVCYDNSAYTGWQSGYPDASAKIDLSTYRNVPWDGGVPFFLADFDAGPCPRQMLKGVLARVAKAGFASSCGMEFEWFNFAETSKSLVEKNWHKMESLTPGMFGYSLTRMNQNGGFLNALMDQMGEFRVPIEGLHTETGPGVFEVAILYSDALEAADRAVLFKGGTKEIGHRFGVMPTFMAKWNSTLPGCSGHTHQSLWDTARSKNLFFDDKDPFKMSDTFRSYVAGQMAALPEILPFFAPTINSYKRLVDGYWAPTKVTWGIDNRTVALRVIPGSSKSTRLETRVPGSDVNPYLAVAASVGAGLYGVEKGLKLTAPAVKGSGYHTDAERLPRNLWDATRKMADSKLANEIFGEAFVSHFVKTREWEWRQFQDSVTNWELQRYFEII
jgi:glutamine synthetase